VDISCWKSLPGEKQADWSIIHCPGRSSGTSFMNLPLQKSIFLAVWTKARKSIYYIIHRNDPCMQKYLWFSAQFKLSPDAPPSWNTIYIPW
jgi:hypothetical protein